MADQVLCAGTRCPHCGAMMTSSEIRQGRVIQTEEVTGPDGNPVVKSHLQCPNPNCPGWMDKEEDNDDDPED